MFLQTLLKICKNSCAVQPCRICSSIANLASDKGALFCSTPTSVFLEIDQRKLDIKKRQAKTTGPVQQTLPAGTDFLGHRCSL